MLTASPVLLVASELAAGMAASRGAAALGAGTAVDTLGGMQRALKAVLGGRNREQKGEVHPCHRLPSPLGKGNTGGKQNPHE